MTLFFLILLIVSLSIFGFQRLRRKQKKPTIKPSLSKVEELVEKLTPEQPVPEPKPEWSISTPIMGSMLGIPHRTIQPITPELHKEPKPEWPAPKPVIVEPKEPISLPVSQPANPVSPEPENPISVPEPIKKEDKTSEWPPEPVSLPLEEEPIPTPEPIVVEQPLLKPKSISLPLEQEPIMLSPKEPEPPGNLPVE